MIRLNNPDYKKPLLKRQGFALPLFLAIITLGLYVPFFYKKYVPKINILSRDAFGEHHKDIWFSPKLFFAALAMVILPWVSLMLYGFIPKIPIINALIEALYLHVVVIVIIAAIITLICMLHIMYATVNRLKLIAKQYDRMDVFLLIDRSSFLWMEYNGIRGFNELADEYNMRHNAGIYMP